MYCNIEGSVHPIQVWTSARHPTCRIYNRPQYAMSLNPPLGGTFPFFGCPLSNLGILNHFTIIHPPTDRPILPHNSFAIQFKSSSLPVLLRTSMTSKDLKRFYFGFTYGWVAKNRAIKENLGFYFHKIANHKKTQASYK